MRLHPVLAVRAQEAQRVGAGEAGVDAVDVGLQLADERTVVGRVERRPELLHDAPAGVLEGPVEARRTLVAVGEVVGDHRDALQAELLGRVVAHRVHRLRGGAVGVDHVVAPSLLREVVLRRGHRRKERHFRLQHVVVERQRLERGERADQHVDLVALDQLLGFGLRLRRLARGVGEDDLDLASGERVVALLEEEVDAILHLLAARGERTGAHREKADAQGLALRESAARERGERDERQQEPHRNVHDSSIDGNCCVGAILPALAPEAYNARMRPELLKLAAGFAEREERFAIVTVVRREPPSSAHVGDVALVTERGEYHGWTGGGCTRSSVLLEAMRAIADGKPRLLSLSPEPEGGRRPGVVFLPMTCDSGGTVEIYVEPVLPASAAAALRQLARRARARRASRTRWATASTSIDPDADESAFPDARVRRSMAPDDLPRGAHVLVATMGDRDVEAIESALARSPAYVGVIASAKRFALLRDALLARGVPSEALERVAAPAGTGHRRAISRGDRREHHGADRRAPSRRVEVCGRRRRRRRRARRSIPVCGMSVAVAGARHTAEVLGVAYYFCCAGCRTKFLAEPARFLGASKAVGS